MGIGAYRVNKIYEKKVCIAMRGLRNGDEGRKEKNSPAHVPFPRACRSRVLIVRPLCINNYSDQTSLQINVRQSNSKLRS